MQNTNTPKTKEKIAMTVLCGITFDDLVKKIADELSSMSPMCINPVGIKPIVVCFNEENASKNFATIFRIAVEQALQGINKVLIDNLVVLSIQDITANLKYDIESIKTYLEKSFTRSVQAFVVL